MIAYTVDDLRGLLRLLEELKGDTLERRYRQRAPPYFASLVQWALVLAGGG